MKRLAHTAVLATVIALVLSGCVRYDIDMTVASDNTASGTVTLGVKTGAADELNIEGREPVVTSDEQAFTELFGEHPFGSNFEETPYEDADWLGRSYAFESVGIDDLTELAPLFTVTRTGDEFVVRGEEIPLGDLDQEEREKLADESELIVSITFPGEVTDTNGTVQGTTVTWNLLSGSEPMFAQAQAPDGTSEAGISPVMMRLGIAITGLAALLAFLLYLRRRATPGPVDAASAPDAPRDAIDADAADAQAGSVAEPEPATKPAAPSATPGATKAQAKRKSPATPRAAAKPKSPAKPKTPAKPKSPAKPKTPAKPKGTPKPSSSDDAPGGTP